MSQVIERRVAAFDGNDVWVRNMRKQFCIRSEFPETINIIDEEGNLRQEYFRSEVVEQEERKWTENERLLLIKGILKLLALGIEEFGIGHFREISETYLPKWVIFGNAYITERE